MRVGLALMYYAYDTEYAQQVIIRYSMGFSLACGRCYDPAF